MSLELEEKILLEELKDRKIVIGEIFLSYIKRRDKINKSELEKIIKKMVKEGKLRADEKINLNGKKYTRFRYIGK